MRGEIIILNRKRQWYLHLLYLLLMFPLNYFNPKRGLWIALGVSGVIGLYLLFEYFIITQMPAIILTSRELRIRRSFYYKTYPRSEVISLEHTSDHQFRFVLHSGKSHKIESVWFHKKDLAKLESELNTSIK